MITCIKHQKECKLVPGSKDVTIVTVSPSPQSMPLDFIFTEQDDYLAFVKRLSEPDAEDFVGSLVAYQSK